MRQAAVLVLASCACALVVSPTIAQSSSGFELARTSFTSVHHYVASEAIPTQLAPPPNLVVTAMYRPIVESMLRGSPTFRRQCIRISAEPRLTVHLTISMHPRRSDIRAQTRLTRSAAGHLTAAIDIAPLENLQELIAHELEHVIEQLDGVDLEARAARSNTGVRAVGIAADMFETVRAQRAGLKVASELRQ